MNRFPFPSCLAGLLLLSSVSAQTAPAPAAPPVITFGTGFDFSRGDYGLATDTEVISVPLILGYSTGPWSFDARVPWTRIEGPATVVAGGGTTVRPTTAAESGLGDIFVSSSYRFGAVVGGLNMSATVRVKLPTADESRGLGTGLADYYGQVDFYQTFGAITPFASLGYSMLGSNATYALEDGPYATAGARFRTSDRTVLAAALNWRDRLVAGGPYGTEAMLAVTHDLNARWRLLVYAMGGFTDASPDVAGGLQFSYRF
jgi:hypothetical protein